MRKLTEEQVIAHRIGNKATYANMTPEQRQQRRERQRMANAASSRKEAMKISRKRFKELREDILNPESIAMENPLYIPEVALLDAEASRQHGSMLNPSNWVIPEISARSLYIPPTEEDMEEDGYDT